MSKPALVEKLNVIADIEGLSKPVGVLALDGPNLYFEYADDFQKSGLELSPFHLSTKRKLYKNPGRRKDYHHLPGVFIDSLAEGWGAQLQKNLQVAKGSPQTILQRLAAIGDRGLGALRYEPEQCEPAPDIENPIDIEKLAANAQQFADNKNTTLSDDLIFAGSYVGGTNPKALIGINPKINKIFHGVYQLSDDHDLYILKLHLHNLNKSEGALEFLYSKLAQDAGINMPETKLVEVGSEKYFAVKRFDRVGKDKLHMHSLQSLIDPPDNTPVPYEAFFKTTMFLTKDMSQVYEAYRRLSFGVAMHNRDNHPGNHAFLMNAKGEWKLSPAYDLSYAQAPGKQLPMQSPTPGELTQDDVIKIGVDNGISNKKCKDIQAEIAEAVAKFPKVADRLGVEADIISKVKKSMSKYFGKQMSR